MAAEPEAEFEIQKEQRLFEALDDFVRKPGHRVFAVLDGSMIDRLPAKLAESGLYHRSLVHETAGRNVAVTGVWLIDPAATPSMPIPFTSDDGDLTDEAMAHKAEAIAEAARAALEAGDETGGGAFSKVSAASSADPVAGLSAVRQIAGSGPGLVFWCGGEALSFDVLFKHLRGIGRVILEAPKEEIALFRHADSNVLAQVLPALDEPELARFAGPAHFLLFAPSMEWGGRLKRVVRPDATPSSMNAMLRLKAPAIQRLQEVRLQRSRAKIATYLRKVAPDETGGLDDVMLMGRVRQYESSGQELGLRSERAHAQWSFLMLTSDGSVAKDDDVRSAFVKSRPGHADDTMYRIMRQMERLSARDASASKGG